MFILIGLYFINLNIVFAQQISIVDDFDQWDVEYGWDEFIDIQPSPNIDNTNDDTPTEPSQSPNIGTQNTFARQSLFNRLMRTIGIVWAIGIVIFFIARWNKKRWK